MTILHKNLSGAQLHEPKGVSGASSGTYYLSDGAAGGSWTNIYDLVEDTSIYGVTDVEITGLGGFKDIKIDLYNLLYNAIGTLNLVVGDSSSYLTTSGYFGFSQYHTTETFYTTPRSSVILSTDQTTGTYYQNGVVYISNFNKNKYSTILYHGTSSSSSGITGTGYTGNSWWRTEEERDYDRIKISPIFGTMSGTAIRVFGLKG